MAQEVLWELERRFWMEGGEFYRDRLAVEALMVFPPPTGILGRKGSIDAVDGVPRFQSVQFRDKELRRVEGTVALGYRAVATRGEERYTALCGSVYVRSDDGWRLMFHQQSPAA